MIEIVSGGVPGPELTALKAAEYVGFKTSGVAPRSIQQKYVERFNLHQMDFDSSRLRYIENLRVCDGVVLCGFRKKNGWLENFAYREQRPKFMMPTAQQMNPKNYKQGLTGLIKWIEVHQHEKLYIGGNTIEEMLYINQFVWDIIVDLAQAIKDFTIDSLPMLFLDELFNPDINNEERLLQIVKNKIYRSECYPMETYHQLEQQTANMSIDNMKIVLSEFFNLIEEHP